MPSRRRFLGAVVAAGAAAATAGCAAPAQSPPTTTAPPKPEATKPAAPTAAGPPTTTAPASSTRASTGAATPPATTPPAANPPEAAKPAAGATTAPATAPTATGGTTDLAPGGTLTIAIGRAWGAHDANAYTSNFLIMNELFDPLVAYGDGGKIQPALAQSWDVSPDGKTYTFRLRSGLKFSDGSPLDAEAVRHSLSRWVVPANSWLPASNLIEAYSATDAATVVVRLKKAYYGFMQELALVRPVRVMSKSSLNPDGSFRAPIGSGRFKLEQDVPGQRTVLARNEHWWGPRPGVDRLVFALLPDPQTRTTALIRGEIDLVGGEYLSPIPPSALTTLRGAASQGVKVHSGTGTSTLVGMFNYERPPFDDVRVREALNHAIDRAGLNEAIFAGTYVPADALMPPTVPYAPPANKTLYGYDREKAKSLLAQAGWTPGSDGVLVKDGKPFRVNIVLHQSNFPYAKALGEALQGQLRAVGIALDIRVVEAAVYNDVMLKLDYDLTAQLTFGAPYDPHSGILTWFSRADRNAHSTMFSSPQLDALMDQVIGSTNESDRASLYRRMWQHVDDNVAALPLFFTTRSYATGRRVEGFALAPSEYDLSLVGVRVRP